MGEDIYLAPYYGNVTVMMYNKQLLADAATPPRISDSFADLMDIAQKTKAADSNKNRFPDPRRSARQHPVRLPAPPGCPRRLGRG